MPYCPLFTSCPLSKEQIKELVSKITEAFVQAAGKPATAVMINVVPNSHLFLNEEGDTAFFEINAVGMEAAMIETVGIRFLEIIAMITNITYDRIFVQFNMSDPSAWIIKGHTLAYWRKQQAVEGKK